MYGCSRGIIFSKLALSVTRVACHASRTVTTRQSSTTRARWLKSARSSTEPEVLSKSSRLPADGVGEVFTCMAQSKLREDKEGAMRHAPAIPTATRALSDVSLTEVKGSPSDTVMG